MRDDEVMAALRDDLRFRRLNASTVEKYTSCVELFRAFDATEPLASREREHIRSWLRHLAADRGAAPATVGVHAAALRFLFRFTLGRPELAAGMLVPLGHVGGRPPVVVPTVDEVRRLLAASPHPVAELALRIAYATGLRIGEVCALRREDVRGVHLLARRCKGGAARTVYGGEVLARDVARLDAANEADSPEPALLAAERAVRWERLAPNGPWLVPARVWPAAELRWADRPAGPRSVRRWFRIAAEHVGLPPETRFHALRHAYACHLADAGLDRRSLQRALGHRRLETTERYLRALEAGNPPATSPLDLMEAAAASGTNRYD